MLLKKPSNVKNGMVSLGVRAVTKAKDGEMKLAQTRRRQFLPQEALPEDVGIVRNISLTSCGRDKDCERVPDHFFLGRRVFVNKYFVSRPCGKQSAAFIVAYQRHIIHRLN